MDAVVFSTVLSSVIDPIDRARVAREALRVVRPRGAIVCYDARVPNPWNRQVRAISRAELGRLFPGCELEARSITLLPPLARRLGRATSLVYPKLASLAPLRTHAVAVIRPAHASARPEPLTGAGAT